MTTLAAPRILGSTLGKKVVMALTGIILFGFLIVHMVGNLQLYTGPEKLDAYAAFLQGTPALVWGTRIILLLALVTHIAVSANLAKLQSQARPVRYAMRNWRTASYASRTMILSGPIIAFFVAYHLAHFTIGCVHPDWPNFVHANVYANVVAGFKVVPVSILYIVANALLGLHLWHGSYSFFQTLGLSNARFKLGLQRLGAGITLAITLVNISFPIAVMSGVVK